MPKKKPDIVVEAVHYSKNQQIDWVRAYERRGPTYSDRIILSRPELVQRLKDGKRVFAGKRLPLLASTFETSNSIECVQLNGKEILRSAGLKIQHDQLLDVPLI